MVNLLKRPAPQEQDASVVPLFAGGNGEAEFTPAQKRSMMRPVLIGCVLIGVFVVGLLTWAGFSSVSGAVLAPGVVRAEANRQTVKSLEGGIVRQILVRNGDRVRVGQPLLIFDDVQPRAQVDVYSRQYDGLLAQRARFQAEVLGQGAIVFPAELTSRRGDPFVGALMAEQQSLFQTRRMVLNSQAAVLRQQILGLESRIGGLQIQSASIAEQSALISEELSGMQKLHEQGYAPKTRVLALQRSVADLNGRRGAQIADIDRTRESIGEIQIKLSGLRQNYVGEAAAGLETVQAQIAEVEPRLRAARDALAHTRVTAPSDGYVLNLSQFTVGGVAGAGETLLDVVPADAPLVIDARVRPNDIEQVTPGMAARVQLSAYSTRLAPRVEADVTTVAADRVIDERTGEPYFPVELRIRPDELKKFNGKVKLYPGMPADTQITTGKRTILDFLIGPVRDTLSDSLRED